MPISWYSSIIGINKTTYYRWKNSPKDKRKDTNHPHLPQYTKLHEAMTLSYIKQNPDLCVDELIAHCLDLKDDEGKSIGVFLGSRSYVYRLMKREKLDNNKRNGGKGRRHNFNKKRLIAKGPNQIYVWDITYLYKDIEGEYFYLYAMMDLFSRKMIHYEVHEKQSDSIAAKFIERALAKENIAVKGHLPKNKDINDDITITDSLTLHSDNGGPMKGKNMLVKLESLGITASYSRPMHSNDNAAMESSFATLKHSHSMPIPKCFSTVEKAQEWVNQFYEWYNTKHLHSGIGYITPNDCHNGRAPQIIENRNRIIRESSIRCCKGYSLPNEVSLMSFSVKRKCVEKNTKKAEYNKTAA